jgi:hypothetical protein
VTEADAELEGFASDRVAGFIAKPAFPK